MKTIEVDEELYHYIASHTRHIGESASDILRRMLKFNANAAPQPKSGNKEEGVVSGKRSTAQIACVETLLAAPDYLQQKLVVNRFLQLLSVLYRSDKETFSHVADALQGRSRLYFAKQQQVLLQHGTKSNPKKVPDTPYWVITNTNSARKRAIIEQVMTEMQFPVRLVKDVFKTI